MKWLIDWLILIACRPVWYYFVLKKSARYGQGAFVLTFCVVSSVSSIPVKKKIFIHIRSAYDEFPDFFRMATLIDSTLMKLYALRSNLLQLQCTCSTFQQLLEGPMEVLLCERVNGLRHRLFHLFKCLRTTASELGEQPKVTGSKVWTIGWVRNCFDTHLGQIVCDKDGNVNLCIVLVVMPLTRFEERWPLPAESFPQLPQSINIVTLTLTLCTINSGVLTSLLLPYLS